MKQKIEIGLTEKIIILFTSNFQGGILQFTIQLGVVLRKLKYRVVMFIPDNATEIEHGRDSVFINKYKRHKSLTHNNRFSTEIANKIKGFDPKLVLFCDDGIISTQTLLALKKACRTIMCIHDVKPHSTKFDIYDYTKQVLKKKVLKQALNITDQIILLSENSYSLFNGLYPIYENKATWMPLGAHVPEVEPQKPIEFCDKHKPGYYLFFGRISKYKGIKNLLQAYNSIIAEEKPMLVIAGSGELQIEEKELINKSFSIMLINRFIEDGEMLYLIQNSRTVVLPYIEASQSGVIPIAYHFGIPVITSNVPGLVEFVNNGVSGIVCSDNNEMKEALLKIRNDDLHEQLSKGAFKFYRERLNWSMNVNRCINFSDHR